MEPHRREGSRDRRPSLTAETRGAAALRRAVFLDRDGVLNVPFVRDGKPYAPRNFNEFQLYPDVRDGVTRLHLAGFLMIVTTNQPDIGNGLTDRSEVEAMHERLLADLPIARVMMCPHAQSAGCDCRKPRPGMLLEATQQFDIDLHASIMVGDRAGDIAAGRAAGCRTIFIDRHYAADARPEAPDRTVFSFEAAVAAILDPDGVFFHGS